MKLKVKAMSEKEKEEKKNEIEKAKEEIEIIEDGDLVILRKGGPEVERDIIISKVATELKCIRKALQDIRRYSEFVFERLERDTGIRAEVASKIGYDESGMPYLVIKVDGWRFVGKPFRYIVIKKREWETELKHEYLPQGGS